jgi:hypothetical protein
MLTTVNKHACGAQLHAYVYGVQVQQLHVACGAGVQAQ